MLTDEEFESKFRYLVGELLPEERVTALLEACARLEQLRDVGELLRLTLAAVRV